MSSHVHRYRESREDRNKRVALELVGIIERVIADEAVHLTHELEALRRRWEGRGVTWLRPDRVPFDPDEWLTAHDMAERADVEPATVRRWAYRGHISTQNGLYNVGEVVKYQARRRIGG